jgi:hypothetical protein
MSDSDTPPLRLATELLHADDEFHGPEVSPSISVSTSPLFYTYLNVVLTSLVLQLSDTVNLRSSLLKTS